MRFPPSFALVGTLLLGGCAGVHTLTSEVSSFGDWPADRKAGTYVFERLPSQQARAADAEELENAARGALAAAGFTAAAADAPPDVVVQVGARAGVSAITPWNDPLWWRGGYGPWRYGPWTGPRWGLGVSVDALRYEREVAVLIRDRTSGRPLFEARASNEGAASRVGPRTLAAMFEAALMDFPRTGVNPRRVAVDWTE